MVIAKVKLKKTYLLSLDEDAANWLKVLVQNPFTETFDDGGSREETDEDKKYREEFFYAIQNAQNSG